MTEMPHNDVLTPSEIYAGLKTQLGVAIGVDADVLKILEENVLHENVDEQTSSKTSVDKLLKLAVDRAAEEIDGKSSV